MATRMAEEETMDTEKAIFRLVLAALGVAAVVMTASSWHEIKRYARISRM